MSRAIELAKQFGMDWASSPREIEAFYQAACADQIRKDATVCMEISDEAGELDSGYTACGHCHDAILAQLPKP